jgi:putative hydrolase of HD superfamily
MDSKDLDKIVSFLFESGTLKLIPRSGWFKIGIKNPESVAEHSFRTALISAILTFLETGDFEKACVSSFLALIHDLEEVRTLDLHKISKRYVKVERDALKDQLEHLPKGFVERVELAFEELRDFVEDADKIELLLQAKEYSETHPSSKLYTANLKFKTKTAKRLVEAIERSDHRWWLNVE